MISPKTVLTWSAGAASTAAVYWGGNISIFSGAQEVSIWLLPLMKPTKLWWAAVAKAQEMNIKISVAVCDAGGRLVAFNRMDGAIWGGVYGSQGKAVASAAFARPSGELQERAGPRPSSSGIATAEMGHMIPSQGAVPAIIRNGMVEGACGVGGTSQQDETVPALVLRAAIGDVDVGGLCPR